MKNPETIAKLKRKIELLEARLVEAEAKIDKHFDVYRENLYDKVDLEIRIKQALQILQGEE